MSDTPALPPPPPPTCTCKDQATQPTGWCAQHKLGWVKGGITPPKAPVRPSMPQQLVGWECPRCTAIMNPHYPACINCTGRAKTT